MNPTELEAHLLKLNDCLPAELEAKLVEWNARSARMGLEWAEVQGEAKSVADRKEDVLADLMSKCDEKSEAAKERKVRISDEWKLFRQSVVDSQAEALVKKIRYEVAIRTFETVRSLLSTKNTERRFT